MIKTDAGAVRERTLPRDSGLLDVVTNDYELFSRNRKRFSLEAKSAF
jgi:hypothetical protein